MKTIGKTIENKFLVEMSYEEYSEFRRLEDSIDGRYTQFEGNFGGTDLSPIFKALSDLSTAKQSVSSLKSYVDTLVKYLGEVHTVEEINKTEEEK